MIKRLRAMFKGERWSINCDFHNWTLHDLSTSEARACLETLRDSEKATVLVWKAGWPTWRQLRDNDCAELLENRGAKSEAPPIPSDGEYDPEITAVRTVDPKNPFHTRKLPRFDVDYPVLVASGTQEFRTRCLDISEGGLRVSEPLPDWVAGYCSVIMTVENGRVLELLCSIAEDQKHLKTRFEIVPSEKQPEFLAWFQSHPLFQTSS